MKLLLDTHTFIWFIAGSPRLSAPAREAIEAAENDRFLSAASIFEMAIQISLGKLRIEEPLEQLLARELDSSAFCLLSIEVRHVAILASLPFHHRDPFDRALVVAETFVHHHEKSSAKLATQSADNSLRRTIPTEVHSAKGTT